MKLKFKATKQDWIIFFIFCIFLLFLVSILVNNLHSLSIGDGFAGLNPFTALIENTATVILFYAFALGFLFTSVKDYFFERESGFGILKGNKESKGYSKWCTDKEMKKSLKELNVRDDVYEYAGFPMVSDGNKLWVDDDDTHNLVIGSTGTGKTQCVIHPLIKILAKKGESMIVTDPKGEIYNEAAGLLKKKGYQIVVLNFRDPQKGNTWNPLNLPYKYYKEGNTDKAMEILDDLAANILYEEGGSQDPFWEKTSADYFAGLALGLFEDADEEQVNINSISLMTTQGEEKFGARSTYIKEYFNGKDPAGAAYTCASGTIFAPEETKGSILSTFKQKIRLFSSRENLSEMLSRSDFDMDSIGKQKTAVFMMIQDEKKTYHALATIFVKQCYESLIDVAQHEPSGALPVRTNFILDEFQNMPPFKDITTMIAAARSRKIRLTMIIQNFAGLNATYDENTAQTLRSNCTNMLYLLTGELSALKEISELCGDKLVKVGKGDKEHEETRPLITVADLQRMGKFEAIVRRQRLDPYKTRLKPNFEIDWGEEKIAADPYVVRVKQPVKVFDIKEFVKEKRKDKFDEMTGGANPFAGGMPMGNPFAGAGMMDMPNENSRPFNVDDLVKKIDAKIAELEKEEQMEEEKRKEEETKKKEAIRLENEKKEEEKLEKIASNEELSNIAPTKLTGFINNAVNNLKENDNKEEKVVEEAAPEITRVDPPVDSEVTKYKNVTDDQFFDDFFDE